MTASSLRLSGYAGSHVVAQHDLEARFQPLPSSAAFRQHLETLSSEPHVAGTEANARVGEAIAHAMEKAGLTVQCFPYDVLLSEPDGESQVALVTPIRLPLNNQEYIHAEDPYSSHPELGPGWVAYSGSGDVSGEVVYANYGRKEDFEKLAELGIGIEGKIVVARYGGNFRGFKAKYAQAGGALGLVIYSDPQDGGYVAGAPYPEGRFLSESAIQRGSLLTLPYTGDPLTPFEPALPLDGEQRVERLDIEAVDLPRIPVAPLPHGSAVEILKRMAGQTVPREWQGGLPFTYRLTGGPQLTVRLRVQQRRSIKRISNIVGTIEGSEFPDEWIILGCHYDAWGYGTADPNSGSAALLCLSDALGELLRQGWRPRRTIKVAHWDAEEYALIGSAEWVMQFRQELAEKAIAYINADMAATGSRFGASASPSLKRLVIEAAQAVSRPDAEQTVYERWMAKADDPEEPPIGNLGGGSDHVGFYTHIGVPSAELSLSSPCPVYHSPYDNLTWYERFADGEFIFGPTLARLDGILTLRLANADVLPYSAAFYAPDLKAHLDDLLARAKALDLDVTLDALTTAIEDLAGRATRFEDGRERALRDGGVAPEQMRVVNRTLIGLEKAFIHAPGLQASAWSRSLYACADPYSGYAAWMLPGLRYEIEARSCQGVTDWETIYVGAVRDLIRRLECAASQLE